MSFDITALYSRYRLGLIKRLLRMVRSREAAEDIAQDSFAALIQASEQQRIDFPAAFLHRTASNLALNTLKHDKVVMTHAEQAKREDETFRSAEVIAADDQALARLKQALAELPPRCRDVFVLRRIHGLSQQEVAERLGISESVVKKHIVRGMEHLRRKLGKDF